MKININNITVSYNDNGSQTWPPIVFIHGFPFNKSVWDLQAQALVDNYRVIAYDVRGHGETDTGNSDFSIDIFTNDLIALMDKLELNEAILCGLSMGGYIALNAIVKYAHRFNALILSDTQCIADSPEAKQKRMKMIESIRKNGVENYAGESIKNLFAPESFKTKEKEVVAVKEMIQQTSEQSLCATLLALAERKETCSKLSGIDVPVLIMVGKEDKLTPPEAARLMQEKIPGSELSIIEHAGHVANLENPAEFNYELKGFLHRLIKEHSDVRASNIHG